MWHKEKTEVGREKVNYIWCLMFSGDMSDVNWLKENWSNRAEFWKSYDYWKALVIQNICKFKKSVSLFCKYDSEPYSTIMYYFAYYPKLGQKNRIIFIVFF